MRISIIGAGNVATVFGRLLKQHNHLIKEIYSLHIDNANALAKELDASVCENINNLYPNVDAIILAVKDDSIQSTAEQMQAGNALVLHTSGSVSINVLKNCSANIGVLYPLQSLRKEAETIAQFPVLIDNNDNAKHIINEIAQSISNNIIYADDATRLRYHLSAVFASNFTNHLYALTKMFCDENNLQFDLLLPLIEETTQRLHKHDPSKMQTGPAIRNDESTIKKHMELLENFPHLKKIYTTLNDSIYQFYKKIN